MRWDRCGHCGRDGTLDKADDATVSRTTSEHDTPSGLEEVSVEKRLAIYRCSVCKGPTIRAYTWIDPYSDPSDDLGWRTLYPPEHELNDLPERVAKRLEQMLQLLFMPDAFAVAAGRMLEAVCTDLGFEAGTLDSRLKALAASGTLPKPLADQALLARKYRNIGGHDDDLDLEAEDVQMIRGFIEGLLDFLYWGPAKLKRATRAFEERQAISQRRLTS